MTTVADIGSCWRATGAAVCPRDRCKSKREAAPLEDRGTPGDHAGRPRRQRRCATNPRRRGMSSVQDTVFDIIAKESGIDRSKIKPDATLKDLEIQSLDAVQIIFEIEDHFKVTMPDRDPQFDTESVGGLIATVEKLLAEQTTQPI
jgi:acyl carrier protein